MAGAGQTWPVARSTRPPPYIGSPSRMPASSSRSAAEAANPHRAACRATRQLVRQDVVALPVPSPQRGAEHGAPPRQHHPRAVKRGQHQSPKACRPFSGTAGPAISMTAGPSPALTVTRSEIRLSSALILLPGPQHATPAASTEPTRAAPRLGLSVPRSGGEGGAGRARPDWQAMTTNWTGRRGAQRCVSGPPALPRQDGLPHAWASRLAHDH